MKPEKLFEIMKTGVQLTTEEIHEQLALMTPEENERLRILVRNALDDDEKINMELKRELKKQVKTIMGVVEFQPDEDTEKLYNQAVDTILVFQDAFHEMKPYPHRLAVIFAAFYIAACLQANISNEHMCKMLESAMRTAKVVL